MTVEINSDSKWVEINQDQCSLVTKTLGMYQAQSHKLIFKVFFFGGGRVCGGKTICPKNLSDPSISWQKSCIDFFFFCKIQSRLQLNLT